MNDIPAGNGLVEERIVHVPLGERAYDIVIGERLLEGAGERLKAAFPGRRFGIVTDTEVARAQLPRLEQWEDLPKSALKRLMADPHFPALDTLYRADPANADQIFAYNERTESLHDEGIAPPPFITGNILISLGAAPGPGFKRWLDDLYDRQLDGTLWPAYAPLTIGNQWQKLRLAAHPPGRAKFGQRLRPITNLISRDAYGLAYSGDAASPGTRGLGMFEGCLGILIEQLARRD